MNAFVDEKTTLIKKFKDNYDISVLGELVSFSKYLQIASLDRAKKNRARF
jgi:hypothetical protein